MSIATGRTLREMSSLTKMSHCREKCTSEGSGEILPGGFVSWLNTELRDSERTQDGGVFEDLSKMIGFSCDASTQLQ